MNIFCKVSFNLFCVKGDSPRYRIYVNDELFAERTFIWKNQKGKRCKVLCIHCAKSNVCQKSLDTNHYLREKLQINGPPGEYKIRLESLDSGKFRIRNTTADIGPVEIIDSTTFRITQ